MARREQLIDELWSLIEPLFDKTPAVATPGRPRRIGSDEQDALDSAFRSCVVNYSVNF